MQTQTPRMSRGDVTLRPLTVSDAAAFRALTDEEGWQGMSIPWPQDDAVMAAHFDTVIDVPGVMSFAVELRGELVGKTSFYDLVPGLRTEIGNTYYSRAVWGTVVNPTCKLLLMEHAFETLGLSRVALRCDHRNRRSHEAIARLGATFEGTLRRFRPAADGTIVDVDYFSVVAEEWPAVRAGLLARLGEG